MSVIIRLQNLPWSANALDIRQHFQGLSIPEGGVHIVGGEQGDAFIAFSTDEDARQAMMNGDGKIKEVKVKLQLSSRTEMQKVIEQAREQSVSLQNLLQMPAPPITAPIVVPPTLVISAAVAADTAAKPADRRDSDSTSNSDKERRSERKDRSRSRDRRRRSRDRKSRSRSRDRRRTNDNRRRRRTSRDRRSRSRSRDRSRRTNDNRRNSRERNERRRDSNTDDNKNGKAGENGVTKPFSPAVDSAWDNVTGPKQIGFNKAAEGSGRHVTSGMDTSTSRGDMDGRRIMGSGPFPAGSVRPIPGADSIPGPFQSNRDAWQGRPGDAGGRFPPIDRPTFTGDGPRPGFGSEGNDFDGRGDLVPRAGAFRGSQQRGGSDTRRSPFVPARPSGPGSILGPPGTMMGSNVFPPRGERTFEPFSQRGSFGGFNRGYDPRSQIPGTCVEMRNLPLDSGYSDIRKFFHGIYVANNAIKMLNDAKGHRTGIAYMKFANPDAKDRAIKMTGNQIRGSVIELMHLDDEIFENSVDSYKPDVSSYKPQETSSYKAESSMSQIVKDDEPMIIEQTSPCLQIQDLPPYTAESDIIKLFPDFKIADVVMTYHKEDKRQAMAYVKFVRAEDGKAALYSSQKHLIGHAAVKVSLCSLELFQLAKSLNPKRETKEGSNGSHAKDPRGRVEPERKPIVPMVPLSDCVLLKGLPYQTNDRDILDFFSDVALVPARIHVMLDNFNKPSGDAYCEFAGPEETARAVSKHGTMLGKQEVTVKPVMRHEMLEALGLPSQPDLPLMNMGPRMPFIRNFPGGRPMGILGNRPLRMPLRGGHHMRMMGHMGMGHHHPKEPIEAFGKPGCVLALENIPFRAEVEEILDYFADFEVTRENVIRRFSDTGMPTGDARVSLSSPLEAQRALRDLRGLPIRGRPIFLSIV